MDVTRRVSLALLILFSVAITAFGPGAIAEERATAPAQSSDVERGKHLVDESGQVPGMPHTPRDAVCGKSRLLARFAGRARLDRTGPSGHEMV